MTKLIPNCLSRPALTASAAIALFYGLSQAATSQEAETQPAPAPAPVPAVELTPEMLGTTESWLADGAAAIQARLAQTPNTRRAKNVILFVGDGMGVSTLTAARILEGQLRGEPGEENYLSFERFPYTALVKTYNVDAQVADSAGTATALNTGVKTRIGVINTGPGQPQRTCDGIKSNTLTPIAEYAERAGMSTGVVSTARLTHATPAAVYAVSPSRSWESDADMPETAIGCTDIASQILRPLGGDGLEVALGGGAANFLPTAALDPENPETQPAGGKRTDGRNIPAEWIASTNGAAYVSDAAGLAAIDYSDTSRLLGLFSPSHMDYELDREARPSTPTAQPSLATMTESAIKMLKKNDKGFYLMVEGGRVDHGHHGGNAQRALMDAVALSKAVAKAASMVDLSETLILVTADHSHVFTIAGYPRRGNPIFGLVTPIAAYGDTPELARDGKPYTTLGYQNGPGAIASERPALTHEQVTAHDFQQQAAVPTRSETHGGEDVALFAIGPWAHLATGTMEQNVVFHIIDHALDLRARASWSD